MDARRVCPYRRPQQRLNGGIHCPSGHAQPTPQRPAAAVTPTSRQRGADFTSPPATDSGQAQVGHPGGARVATSALLQVVTLGIGKTTDFFALPIDIRLAIE